jgi:hypothetical protein
MRRPSAGLPVQDRKVGKRDSGDFSQNERCVARAACDFEDDTRHRQDVAKDIENEIAITDCRRRVLAVIDHLPPTFNLALAPLSPRAFVVKVSRDTLEASTARHHCRIRDLSGRDDNALANRLRLALQ